MSNLLLQEGGVANVPYKQYICDTVAELSQLDVHIMGSVAYVTGNQKSYILDGNGTWQEYSSGGGGGGGVQSDYEQNNSTANDYIKNRPIYDTRTFETITDSASRNINDPDGIDGDSAVWGLVGSYYPSEDSNFTLTYNKTNGTPKTVSITQDFTLVDKEVGAYNCYEYEDDDIYISVYLCLSHYGALMLIMGDESEVSLDSKVIVYASYAEGDTGTITYSASTTKNTMTTVTTKNVLTEPTEQLDFGNVYDLSQSGSPLSNPNKYWEVDFSFGMSGINTIFTIKSNYTDMIDGQDKHVSIYFAEMLRIYIAYDQQGIQEIKEDIGITANIGSPIAIIPSSVISELSTGTLTYKLGSGEVKQIDNKYVSSILYDINQNSETISTVSSRTFSIERIIANDWSYSNSYNIGDYCINYDKLYRCIVPVPASIVWDSSYWVQVTVDAELKTKQGTLTAGSGISINNGVIANTQTPGTVVSGTNDGTNWSTITIDGTTKAIPSGGSGVQSDYAQNNSSAADYIKNRPVYDTRVSSTETVNFNHNNPVATAEGFEYFEGTVTSYPTSSTQFTLTITVDGTPLELDKSDMIYDPAVEEHDVSSYYYLNGSNMIYLYLAHSAAGVTFISNALGYTPSSSLAAAIYADDYGTTATVTAKYESTVTTGTLKKLEQKYIDIDYSQNDSTAVNYIKNRPCYDELTEFTSTKTGDLYDVQVSNINYYILNPIDRPCIRTSSWDVHVPNSISQNTHIKSTDTPDIISDDYGYWPNGMFRVYIPFTATGIQSIRTAYNLPDALNINVGSIVLRVPSSYISSSYTITCTYKANIVHKLDTKYIPNNINVTWGSLTGTLSSQTDLQSALNTKLNASKCTFQTTAPTAAATDGGVHIVYLTSEPATKYSGYIYLIAEA